MATLPRAASTASCGSRRWRWPQRSSRASMLPGCEAGLPPATLAQMIKLLSWDIDFQRDLQPGDRLEAVYRRQLERCRRARRCGRTRLRGTGNAVGARSKPIAHSTPDGRSDFYDRQGRSLRKWLLKTPVDGARLSSGFGSRRHPILGYTRMHRGIDFAAPTGTPVLAAGAGVVEFAGRNRGYGNYLRLRHNRDYATAYGHLTQVRARDASRPAGRAGRGDRLCRAPPASPPGRTCTTSCWWTAARSIR